MFDFGKEINDLLGVNPAKSTAQEVLSTINKLREQLTKEKQCNHCDHSEDRSTTAKSAE